ncbi:MAG: hypothetical protein L0Y66_27540 [Myxococcaceae bacterium]|nr:hypothetical protein [Myxococcaceae bacterium]MCI0672250.1 hypothetical protein [Myxococcaceae bacterium]
MARRVPARLKPPASPECRYCQLLGKACDGHLLKHFQAEYHRERRARLAAERRVAQLEAELAALKGGR